MSICNLLHIANGKKVSDKSFCSCVFSPLCVQTNKHMSCCLDPYDNWHAATVLRHCVSDLGSLPSPTNSSNKSRLLRYLPKPLSMVLPSSACHKMMADSSIMMIIHTQVPSSPLSSRDFLVMSKQSFGSSSPLYCTTQLWL